MSRKKSAWVVAIFVVALGVRLAHIWQLRRSPFFTALLGDARSYDAWAQGIAGGDWIGHEVFYQAPLYPYFLGVLYAIAGRNLLVIRVVQAVLGSLACVCLGLAGARLFSPRVGIVAGLMLALYAPAIFFDALIQKSVLDVFFVCVTLWLIAGNKKDTKDTKVTSLWLGLAIGALSLTRENAIVFAVVIAIWLLWAGPSIAERSSLRSSRPLRSSLQWRPAAAFLLGFVIVVAPVAIRNSVLDGGFYVTTSQFGTNFYIGNNPRADGSYQSLRFGRGAPEYERQDATELAERATGRRLTPAEVSRYWTDRALDFITERPVDWLRLVARKIALLGNAVEVLDTESQESHAEWSLPLRIASSVGHFGVLVPLAVLGVIVTWRERSRLWVLHAMLVAYAVSVVLFYVFARYRYPLVPLLILFAAAGLAHMWHRAFGAARRDPDRLRQGYRPSTMLTAPRATSRGGGPPKLHANAERAAPRSLTVAVVVASAIFSNWPLVSRDLNRSVTEHNLATALMSEGRSDEALAHYRRAVQISPGYAPAYNNMASVLRAQGHIREAEASYERALALRPDYSDAHYNLANALLDEGRTDEAVAHFEHALQSTGGAADVHNNLGIALAAKGRRDEAIAEFRQAVELDPESANAHRNLGDALASRGERDEAIDHLRRATQLAPADAAAHYDLGSTLLEAGRLDEAVAEFRAAIRLAPTAEAHNNLGIALGSQGKLDEAIAEFEAAVRIHPEFVDARRNLETARSAQKRR